MTAAGPDADVAPFDRHRRLLFTVAYEMLGTVGDAEDVVQDTWLRWSAASRDDVADARAYLVRITTRLALDRLRAARAQRETYVGPWLPEPLLTADDDPAAAAELGEQVSLALLVVLETLSPLERAVFVLREVFGLSHAEVGEALGRSDSAVRQIAHRAREHVQARRPRFATDRRSAREATERFLAACVGGDVEALLQALAPDVVLLTDGGGRVRAALRPVSGADKVARLLVALAAQTVDVPGLRVAVADINGAPAILAWSAEGPFLAIQLVPTGDRIDQILMIRNPDKLAGIADAGVVGARLHGSVPGPAVGLRRAGRTGSS